MPTAEKFCTRGAGNGFTTCPRKVNVAGWAHVAPLTLDEMWRIWWYIYGVTGEASWTFTDEDGSHGEIETNVNIESAPIGECIKFGGGGIVDIAGKGSPINRVCWASFYEFSTGNEDGILTRAQIRVRSTLHRMYNGPTNDEDNFIGYGYGFDLFNDDLNMRGLVRVESQPPGARPVVELGNFYEFGDKNTATERITVGPVTIAGFDMIGLARVYGENWDNRNVSLDPLEATMDLSGGDTPSSAFSAEAKANLNGIEFYEYP